MHTHKVQCYNATIVYLLPDFTTKTDSTRTTTHHTWLRHLLVEDISRKKRHQHRHQKSQHSRCGCSIRLVQFREKYRPGALTSTPWRLLATPILSAPEEFRDQFDKERTSRSQPTHAMHVRLRHTYILASSCSMRSTPSHPLSRSLFRRKKSSASEGSPAARKYRGALSPVLLAPPFCDVQGRCCGCCCCEHADRVSFTACAFGQRSPPTSPAPACRGCWGFRGPVRSP